MCTAAVHVDTAKKNLPRKCLGSTPVEKKVGKSEYEYVVYSQK